MDIFIGFLYGVCGTLIGGLAAHFLSRDREHRMEFNKSAATFKSTFTSELRELRNLIKYDKKLIEEDILKLLIDSAVKFENACINFTPYLSATERTSFNNAWHKYCHPKGGKPKDMPGPFYEYFINPDPKHDYVNLLDSVKLIINNIEELLKFAALK